MLYIYICNVPWQFLSFVQHQILPEISNDSSELLSDIFLPMLNKEDEANYTSG